MENQAEKTMTWKLALDRDSVGELPADGASFLL